jgi:hypothetical protein
VAVALVGEKTSAEADRKDKVTVHTMVAGDPALCGLIQQADAVVALRGAGELNELREATTPVAVVSPGSSSLPPSVISFASMDDPGLAEFCLRPGAVPA